MADPLQILVVGAGRMGAVHLETLTDAPSAAAVAVVDPVAEVRERLRADGLTAHASLDDAITIGGFDAAVVAAPSGLHLDIVRRLLAAGIPTLCEKPCGLRSTETQEAVTLAADAGVVLQVGYWRRFVPELRQLRTRIAAGELGELALVQSWQWDEAPPAAAFRLRSGGIALDMGVHEFDQIRWITGEELVIDSVVESSVTSDPPVENDPESAAIVGTLAGGGIAFVSLGRRYGPGDSCWLEVIGTRDVARCEFMTSPTGDDVFRAALVAQIEAFAAAVHGEPTDAATADDAVAALQAVEQVRRSERS